MNRPDEVFFQNSNAASKCFSLLNLFELPGGEHNIELHTKFRQIGVFYWACLIFAPYFIAEQFFSFQTTRYWSILIPNYLLLALAPLVYQNSQSLRLYSAYTVVLGIGLVYSIMACAGGNLSPGAFWLVGTPLVFGLFYGTLGVWIGGGIMALAFFTFVGLNQMHLLPNLVAEHGDYEQVKLINLIGFGIYNILISHYFVRLEENAKKELRIQRQETENLLRIVVHDVAGPINAIQLMTHAAKSSGVEPVQILRLIDNTLDDLAAIVQQVRKLRALNDGKLTLKLSRVPIQATLHDAIDLAGQQAELKNIHFLCELAAEPTYVLADEALLKSIVFANILSNAIKFSHPDQSIDIQLRVSANHVSLQICDQGIGMPDELLKHIFDPTKPTTRPGTNGEAGTGFGMPLVKIILTKMGGVIEVTSSQDPSCSGTTVTVSLPKYRSCDDD